MAEQDNRHVPTHAMRERVKSWSFAGIPQATQAQLAGIAIETLRKHYAKELKTARAEMVGKIANCASVQALEGNDGMQKFILKMLGAEFGWQEKQVIESQNSEEMEQLQKQVMELDKKHESEY